MHQILAGHKHVFLDLGHDADSRILLHVDCYVALITRLFSFFQQKLLNIHLDSKCCNNVCCVLVIYIAVTRRQII